MDLFVIVPVCILIWFAVIGSIFVTVLFMAITESRREPDFLVATVKRIDLRVANDASREIWHLVLPDGTEMRVNNYANLFGGKSIDDMLRLSGMITEGQQYTIEVRGYVWKVFGIYRNVYGVT